MMQLLLNLFRHFDKFFIRGNSSYSIDVKVAIKDVTFFSLTTLTTFFSTTLRYKKRLTRFTTLF